jgi:hypothetical protein
MLGVDSLTIPAALVESKILAAGVSIVISLANASSAYSRSLVTAGCLAAVLLRLAHSITSAASLAALAPILAGYIAQAWSLVPATLLGSRSPFCV